MKGLSIFLIVLAAAIPVFQAGAQSASDAGSAPPQGMVRIPGGTFSMGSPANEPDRSSDEENQHQVTVSAFYMGKYDVTVAEFKAFVNATGYKTDAEKYGSGNVRDGSDWVRKADASWKNPYYTQTDAYPVVLVSWNDAVAYCNWRSQQEGLAPCYTIDGSRVGCSWNANGYRLPTEAEWEYACRAGTSAPFHTGNNITTDQANYDGKFPYNGNAKGQYRGKTTPVGSFVPNAYGLFDMHGNVFQWCWDWYGYYGSGSQADPTGAASGNRRILRGGSWDSWASHLRSANRGAADEPGFATAYIGFRLVRGLAR